MNDHLRRLADAFSSSVVAQDTAIRSGDATSGNVHAKKYLEAFDGLVGEEGGINVALTLLDDERANVRVMAATLLLPQSEAAAIARLEVEAKGVGMTAFGAKQSLARWKEKQRTKARRATKAKAK